MGITPRQHLSAAPVLSAARRFEGQVRVPNKEKDEHGKGWENMLDDWAVVDAVFRKSYISHISILKTVEKKYSIHISLPCLTVMKIETQE